MPASTNDLPILIVEDDQETQRLLEVNLKLHGYDSVISDDGQKGLDLALSNRFASIILDIELPSIDGLEVCRQIREKDPLVPILMLTGRKEELDKVVGLGSGADDYLSKPFSVVEFIARINALVRRSEAVDLAKQQVNQGAKIIKLGWLEIDSQKRRVLVNGEAVELSATEFDLLLFLATNPGRPFSRAEILKEVWGISAGGYENNVNSHVVRIRKKIEPKPTEPTYIQTVWGVGYRFVEEEELKDQ